MNTDLDQELIEAVKNNNYQRVCDLLSNGANPNVFEKNQPETRTALHISASYGYNSITEKLINNKADIDIKNSYGITPLALAMTNGTISKVLLLLKAGANVNYILPSNCFDNVLTDGTYLHLACYYGCNPELIEMLLEYGVDSSYKNKDGLTAEEVARQYHRYSRLDIIIEEHRERALDLKEPDN